MSKDFRTPWTLAEALPFVKSLREALIPIGFGVGLTGSLLYRGTSEKDIDIVLYPLGHPEPPKEIIDLSSLYCALDALGMSCYMDRAATTQTWRDIGSQDTKHVEIWSHGGRRVDLMILR